MAAEIKITIKVDNKKMTLAMAAAQRSIKLFRGSLRGLAGALTSTQAKITGLAGALGAFKLGESFIEANKSIESTFFQLKAVTGSAEEANKSLKFIKEFALKNPVQELEVFSKMFTKLRASGIDPTTGAMQTLTDAASAFALTREQLDGVNLAITQIASNGKFVREEFNQMAERLPNVARIFADQFGTVPEKLFETMRRGAISSEEGLKALFEGLNKRFAGTASQMQSTWTAVVNKLKLEWSFLMLEIGKAGWWDGLKQGIGEVSMLIRKSMGDLVLTSKAFFTLSKQIAQDFLGQFSDTSISTFLKSLVSASTKFYQNLRIGMEALKAGLQVALKIFGDIVRTGQKYGLLDSPQRNRVREIDERLGQLNVSSRPFSRRGARNQADRDKLAAIKAESAELRAERVKLVAEIQAGKNVFHDYGITIEQFQERVGAVQQKMKQLGEEVNVDIEKIGTGDFQPQVTPVDFDGIKTGLNETSKSLDLFVDKSKHTATTFRDGFVGRLQEISQATEKEFGNMARIGEKFADSVSNAMTNSFESFFFDAIEGRVQSMKEVFEGFFKSIAQSIARILSQRLAMALVGSIFGVPATGGFGGFRAEGGPVSAGRSYVVGERGPELFVPKGSGLIVPNHAMTGGGMKNIKIEIINQTSQEIEATESFTRNDFGEQVLGIVIHAANTNRGGLRDLIAGAKA